MTEHPMRIQRRRTKGYRMPPNTVSVSRPGQWGNQFNSGDRSMDVEWYTAWAYDEDQRGFRNTASLVLGGRNLACWCPLCERHKDGKPLDEHCPDCTPCHADVLLEIANKEQHDG